MAEVGYGYTRQETMNLATDYAIELGLRIKSDNTFSDKWLYNFLGRWPELVLKKPRALEVARAKSATRQAVDNYFTELKKILAAKEKDNKYFIDFLLFFVIRSWSFKNLAAKGCRGHSGNKQDAGTGEWTMFLLTSPQNS